MTDNTNILDDHVNYDTSYTRTWTTESPAEYTSLHRVHEKTAPP